MKKNELLIHFTDESVLFRKLNELGIAITDHSKNYIIKIHDSVRTVTPFLPQHLMSDVCFRAANKILKVIECETNQKFMPFKKHHYTL